MTKISTEKKTEQKMGRWKSLYNNLHPGKRTPSLSTFLLLGSICLFSGLTPQKTEWKEVLSVNPIQPLSITKDVAKTTALHKIGMAKVDAKRKGLPLHTDNLDILTAEETDHAINLQKSQQEGMSYSSNIISYPSNFDLLNTSNADIKDNYVGGKKSVQVETGSGNGNNLYFELYTTPGLSSAAFSGFTGTSIRDNNHAPSGGLDNGEIAKSRLYKSWELEAGGALLFDVSQTVRLKAGMQVNYANYVMESDKMSASLFATYSGSPAPENKDNIPTATGSIYRLALPIGTELKLAGNSSISWFAGATFQPSILLSNPENNNWVEDVKTDEIPVSAFRKWNFASTFETFLNYRLTQRTSIKLGPQVRYQFMPSLIPSYNVPERLCQFGLKFGVTGSF